MAMKEESKTATSKADYVTETLCSAKARPGLQEAQAGLKIARRNINHLRYADDTTLMAESGEELKKLDESERGE